MGTIIGVDPGKHSFAWAAGDDDEVLFSGVIEVGAPVVYMKYGLEQAGAKCFIEVPQIYRASKQKGDPNDLIDVAVTAGFVSAFMSDVEFIRPRVWKGTVKKAVMTKRILSKLSPTERFMLGNLAKDHNVVDAVGIVLWAQGRLKK